MPQNIVELGRKVKAKYPGQYDDLTDDEVGRRVKAKYPEDYADFQDVPKLPGPQLPAGLQGQATPMTFMDRLRGNITAEATGGINALKDVGIGAAQSFGNLMRNQTVPTSAGPVTLRRPPEESLQAQNVGQATGQLGGNVAQFMLPSGLVNRGVQAVQGASTALPSVLQKILSTGARAGLEGGSAALVTAGQTGNDPAAMRTAAAIGAGVPLAGAFIAPVAKTIKEAVSTRLAPRIMQSIIKPKKSFIAFGKDPAGELARQGIKANTLEGLRNEIVRKNAIIGGAIGQRLTTPTAAAQRIDIVPLFNGPIDDMIKTAKIDGNAALVSRLEDFRKGQLLERFNLTTTPKAIKLPPIEAQKLKIDVGTATKWTNESVEQSLNEVRREIYRNINTAIDAAVPGVKILNSQYANLLSAEKSVTSRLEVINRADLAGLSDAAAGVAGGMLSVLLSGDVNPSDALAFLGGVALRRGFKSPAMTRLAAQFGKLSPTEKTRLSTQLVPVIRNLALVESQPDK